MTANDQTRDGERCILCWVTAAVNPILVCQPTDCDIIIVAPRGGGMLVGFENMLVLAGSGRCVLCLQACADTHRYGNRYYHGVAWFKSAAQSHVRIWVTLLSENARRTKRRLK